MLAERISYLNQFENLKSSLKPVIPLVTGVIHIGGSFCWEQVIYTDLGIDGDTIHFFEANPEVVKEVKGTVPHIYEAAVSRPEDEGKVLELIITNNSYSSSLLELKDHLGVYPWVKEERRIQVVCHTLDNLQRTHQYWPEDKCPNVLVMDIQGAELMALQGMESTLQGIDYIYTEVSTIEMYAQCVLFSELTSYLEERGFELERSFLEGRPMGDVFYRRKPRKLNLVTSYHVVRIGTGGKTQERQDEYDLTLRQNLANSNVEKIHLFVEGPEAKDRLVQLDLIGPKLHIIEVDKQPKYSTFFEYANMELKHKAVMITNSDIWLNSEFDLSKLKRGHVYALTRHETPTYAPLIQHYCYSHDSFVFISPLSQIDYSALDFHQNVWGSEGRVITELNKKGYTLSNPSLSLKIYHNHRSELRNSDRGDITIKKEFILLKPSTL